MIQQDSSHEHKDRTRRPILAYLATTAAADPDLPAAVAATLESKAPVPGAAEQLAGIEFIVEERDLLLQDFTELIGD